MDLGKVAGVCALAGGLAHPQVQLGLSAGLPSGLSLTRHSLDLKLARDLQLGMEAREPQRPSMEGVGSFPGERGWVRPGQPVCVGQVLGIRPPPTRRRLISAAFAISMNLVKPLPVPRTAQETLV